MSRLSSFALGGSILLTAACAAHALAPPDVPALVGEPLVEIRHWSEVPAAVRSAIERRWDEPGIADPGEPFQEYDYSIAGKHLPSRRLLFAAKAKHTWLVCYEHGGFVLSQHMATVPLDANGAVGEPSWFQFIVASNDQSIKNLAALRTAIRERRFEPGQPPYI